MLCLASARGSTFSIISYPMPLCQVLRGKKHNFFQTLFLNKADASSEMRRRSSEFDNHPFREEHRDAVTATLRYDTTKPSFCQYPFSNFLLKKSHPAFLNTDRLKKHGQSFANPPDCPAGEPAPQRRRLSRLIDWNFPIQR